MTDPYTLTVTDTEDGMLYTAVHQNAPDWFDPNKITSQVTIIGCGDIGSNVAFELITMGFKDFVLYCQTLLYPDCANTAQVSPASHQSEITQAISGSQFAHHQRACGICGAVGLLFLRRTLRGWCQN